MALPIRQGATHKIVLGPAVAVGDGFTPITTLDVSTSDEAEAILHDNGTVVDISGYTWAAITTADGYYHLTLQSGISGTVGHLTVVVNDDSLCLPVKGDFVVLDTVAYDALYKDGATGEFQVDVVKISGDGPAADNLELQYDTTGLTGDTFPGTQSQLSGLANVGSAVHRPAASYVLTTGTQSSGTISSVAALDGTNHEHTDTAGVLDLYYEFEIGAGVASSVQVTGYLTGNNDDLEISGYDWVADAWVRIGTLNGLNAATNRVFNFDLFVDMTGSGVNFGLVRIRFNDGAFTLTTSTLAVDQIFVAFSQQAGGYELGAVWIDTNVSNTNTVPGVDGISTNPVSTIAAANTLATALNLSRFHVASNSSITFAVAQENQEFIGLNWTLALGGQSISNSHITGADVSGTGTAATEAHFDHCEMGDCTLGSCHLDACDIAGDLTFSAAATYFILGCYHSKTTSPVIDFGSAVGAQTVHIHDYHGAMTIKNMDTGDTLHFSSPDGSLTIDSTNTAGTVNLSGTFDLTNNGSGQTINAAGHISQATINTEVDTAFLDNLILRRNTAQAGANASITLDSGASSETDYYRFLYVGIVAGTGAGQARLILAYNGSTKVATTGRTDWATNPDSTSVFVLLINNSVDIRASGIGQSTFTGDAITSGVIAASAIGASELATDAVAEIARAINPQVNTAFSNITFEMYDSTNHNPSAGLTVTGEVSLDGGAYSAVSGTIAEISDGTYQFDADAADMNAALLTLRFSASGADDTFVHIKTAA